MLPDIGWWETRPWIPEDLPPQATAVQIPRSPQAVGCEVKNHAMEAILAKESVQGALALPAWKAFLHIDQLLLQAPCDRRCDLRSARAPSGNVFATRVDRRMRSE